MSGFNSLDLRGHVSFYYPSDKYRIGRFLRWLLGRLPNALSFYPPRWFRPTSALLSEVTIDDEAVALVGSHDTLVELGIVDCEISASSLRPIANLRSLTDVSFADSEFANEQILLELQGCSNLRTLVLEGVSISDQLKDKLKRSMPHVSVS